MAAPDPGKILYYWLSNRAAVTAIVGTRIGPEYHSTRTEAPYITYPLGSREANDPISLSKNRFSGIISLELWDRSSNGWATLQSLHQAIRGDSASPGLHMLKQTQIDDHWLGLAREDNVSSFEERPDDGSSVEWLALLLDYYLYLEPVANFA